MFKITDYITFVVFLYFFYTGWRKGFLRTILGPLSLVAGCLIGYSDYQKNHNMIGALTICIISPFIICLLASLILRLWNKAVNKNQPPSEFSSLSGGIFNILWGGSYLAMMLVLITFIPLKMGWFEKAQKDVLESKSYAFIDRIIKAKVPIGIPDIKNMADVWQDPDKFKKMESTEEFKALQEDKTMLELFSDPQIAELARNKDYNQLLSHPKIQSVFQNKELLEKLFALNKKMMEEDGIGEKTAPETSGIPPAGN
ncbi:MAG: CvpA family protein [Candidatus Omnitrophica bacterium]|nr:CvpA family protein [Candidatus Omnitrophota bacterium]